MTIKIGTCGWARLYEAVPRSERRGESGLQTYAKHYPVVEVNSSFYNFHRTDTYKKWREETPPDFEFTLKCHQSVSHEERLKPTNRALESLRGMVERSEACGAKILLIQTPSSLGAEESVFRDAGRLFERVETERIALAWETRGKSGWIKGRGEDSPIFLTSIRWSTSLTP